MPVNIQIPEWVEREVRPSNPPMPTKHLRPLLSWTTLDDESTELRFGRELWALATVVAEFVEKPSPHHLVTDILAEIIQDKTTEPAPKSARFQLEWNVASPDSPALIFHEGALPLVAILWGVTIPECMAVICGAIHAAIQAAFENHSDGQARH